MAYGAKEQQLPEIRQVTPLKDYRLKLEFTSGSLLILNMADIVGSIRYFPLTDVGIFNSVTTDGWTLFFDTGNERRRCPFIRTRRFGWHFAYRLL